MRGAMSALTSETVLYIGSKSGTSLQRADAARRAGFDVFHVSPYIDLPRHWAPWLNRAGGAGIDFLVNRSLTRQIGSRKFSFAIVDSGDVVGPRSIRSIRDLTPAVANYCQDNPYKDPPPERRRWDIFRRTAHMYDLLVTPKRENANALVQNLTGKSPMQVWFSADEIAHRPVVLPSREALQWRSDVVFVGTWMPGRELFVEQLLRANIPITVYGPRWERAPNFNEIRQSIQPKFLKGLDYATAISNAKIALVMLNGANSDQHTTRSTEIPAIGTAMCAPRTAHHKLLYNEETEVSLFDDVEECISQCRKLLNDDNLRSTIAYRSKLRSVANRTYNEHLMRSIFERLASRSAPS